MISVVIPTYNRASIISETIHSILNQTYSDLEIIVVSDGKSNDTRQIIEGFKDRRLRYYEIEHSGRPSVPRNFGMKQAKGQYLAFCDDDDIWMPEKLELQLAKIVEDDRIGLVYAQCLVPNAKGDIVIPSQGKEGFVFKELFLTYNFIPNSTVLIKREVIQKVGGFDEDIRLKAIEDFDLWLRITQQYKVGFIDKIMAVHKYSSDSISKGTLRKLKREYLIAWKFYYRKEHIGLKLFIKKILSMCLRCIFWVIYRISLLRFIKRKVQYV